MTKTNFIDRNEINTFGNGAKRCCKIVWQRSKAMLQSSNIIEIVAYECNDLYQQRDQAAGAVRNFFLA
jgi:hypothetical protein